MSGRLIPRPRVKEPPLAVTARPAEARDKPAMVRIMDACWQATWVPFMPPAVPARYRDEALGIAFVEHAWQSCRVAEAEGIGIAGFSYLTGRQIKTLQVLPDYQRRGVGRVLLEDAEAEIALTGHGAIRVECDVFNARAAVFYRALGYEETERIDTDILGYRVATHVFTKPAR